jgi:RNA polymerase sigma-70 factor (ECF subfamily)
MNKTRVADAEMERCEIGPDDFEWVVLQHQKQIYRTLLFLVRDADAAEILTQECFLRAFRMRRGFRGESGVATWLVRIAINLAHDHNRSRRWAFWRRLSRADRIDAIRVVDGRRSPEQALIDGELVDVIQSAVDGLSERQRTVFLLRFIEDMPLEAIAEVMDLQVGTVKSHLHRAIEAVRKACTRRATKGR